MLTLALAATLIGFGLLVVALITSNFWLAVACIVVCVLGLVLLLVDALRSSRRSSGVDDAPLFTIRDDEPKTRSAPLLNDDEAPRAEPAPPGAEASAAADPAPVLGAPLAGTGPDEVVVEQTVVESAVVEPSEPVTGDAHDYIKSVTGSFPVQAAPVRPAPVPPEPAPNLAPPASAGGWPLASDPFPAQSGAFATPESGERGPDTGPIRAQSPYVGRRRRLPLDADQRPGPGDVPESGQRTDAGPSPADDGIVVHDHTGPLPKITYLGDDE